MTDLELQQFRREKWRLDGKPIRTIEEARAFLEEVGFCLMYPTRPAFLAPTFIGAFVGGDDHLPEWQHAFKDPRAAQATELMVRMLRERTAFEANLFEENNGFLVAASVFPYFYALMGERNPKLPPKAGSRSAYSALACDAFALIQREGAMSKQKLQETLGGSVSFPALDKALAELWSKLRITRVDYKATEGSVWDVMYRWAPDPVKEGVGLSVPEALTALLSKYLDCVVAAEPSELETFFGNFIARSKVKDAVNALLAARELSFVHVSGKSMLQITPEKVPVVPAPRASQRANPMEPRDASRYRGRLAPSPTGLLHLGHARTFWTAAQRAAQNGGTLIFRNEDLDPQRCRPEFVQAMFDDLRWLGISWTEGPDCGGSFAPYTQSERREQYLAAWRKLCDSGAIYPCTCSRKDVAQSAGAPNDSDDEPLYSGKCRPALDMWRRPPRPSRDGVAERPPSDETPAGVNWRFRVPDGEEVSFTDLHLGPQQMIAGKDFGDFIVWRRDDVPAYQLAVVVDDAAMQITEVVRGADLLKSTARQVLLLRALGFSIPDYYHCDLIRDEAGVRLAKRHDALSIRNLRELGWSPEEVRAGARR